MTKKLSISLWLIIAIHLHSIRTEENIAKQAMNDEINKNILSGNNTKLNELSPQYNNELVAYNQLLPYLYSKLPIPVSLINQLQKYNINKNMLNKIYSYNKLRRELHSKLIENEINGYKYNDILSKKLLNLFKSVNQEEKKNFMNLINYLKMFNFDNNKLYNTLHDGNDLFKLINDNKIKYLPFINTDKNLPDLFINNKVNREIKKILIQYKISSMDLYNKLINKINPHLLEDTKKNNLIPETETMDNTKTEDTKANNPYELLKARIEDLASFRKRPHILPLNEEIPNKKNANDNGNILQKRDGRKIDESLNKYIKDLRLLNEIEKERADLVNSKIDTLLNPNNKNNVQKKAALLQPNPNAELLALYMVLSIPGLLSAIPSKNKRLPHIKKTAEDVPYIEAGQLYNKLSNKNWKVSLSKMHDIINSETYNKFGGLHMENKESKADIKMKYHPFGHQCSNLISNNDYYDAPQMNEYASEAININPVLNVKRKHIFAQDLYSALKSKNKLASALKSKNKLASKKLNNANGLENMKGNNILDVLSNVVPENKQTNQINYKIDGNKLFAQLQKIKNNVPNGNDILNRKIEGQALFDKLKAKACSDGWKEDTIYSKNNNGDSPNEAKYINGNVLFKLLKNKNVPIDAKSNKNGAIMDTEHQIGGQKLFKLLNPHVAEHKEEKVAADPKVNMNKFYEKLYQEFVKDNKGSINKLDNPNKNKVLWHHQNVEIPNISVDMADSNKNNVIKAENENIEWDDSNQAP